MMANWYTPRPRRPELPAWIKAVEAQPTHARTAPHIRGRVYSAGYRTRYGDQMWNLEVVNTRTGRVLITDNCADLERLLAQAHEATAIARGTWFYGLTRKAVQ